MEQSWARIVAWCERMAPRTAAAIRAPAEPAALTRAEAAVGRKWPEELRQWYRLQDGVEGQARLLPSYAPLSSSELVNTWRMYQEVFEELYGDHETYVSSLADLERRPAGEPAGMFLPSYLPIASTNAATDIFVDCRPGPRTGCVVEYLREDADHRGIRWDSLSVMLEDVADSLEKGRPTGHWLPVVEDGELDWEVVNTAGAAPADVGWEPSEGPPEQPDDPQRAAAEIRSAFARAFTGDAPAEAVLSAVEDGLSLAGPLAEARRLQPAVTSTTRVDVDGVQFRDRSRAVVPYRLSWRGENTGLGPPLSLTGLAVLQGGTWRVARESYCEVLRLAGARC